MDSQNPSPNAKTLCNFEPQIWPEIITSRDTESTCSEGSRTSCDVIIVGVFGANLGRKRSHHVMDASFWWKWNHLSFWRFPRFQNDFPQRAPNPPEFAQPSLSRVKARSSPARGANLGVFVPYGQSWGCRGSDQPYRNKHSQICTPSLGTTPLWPYSNLAVQIRVGLELADSLP